MGDHYILSFFCDGRNAKQLEFRKNSIILTTIMEHEKEVNEVNVVVCDLKICSHSMWFQGFQFENRSMWT